MSVHSNKNWYSHSNFLLIVCLLVSSTVNNNCHAFVPIPTRSSTKPLFNTGTPKKTKTIRSSPSKQSKYDDEDTDESKQQQRTPSSATTTDTNPEALKNNDTPTEIFDPILILPIATTITVALLLIGGVVYTKMTNPVTDFDIDFYMALDGTMNGSSGGADGTTRSIVGLPQLSPAEQMVGALFGPPK